ncbi:MAG: YdeI/OmpD-associated family protein [Blastocatellia bacterium]
MKPSTDKSKDQPVMLFASQKDWAKWLDKNHAASSGIWMRLAKKAADLKSVNYAEALDVALCYGWIDGQKKSYDVDSWLQKFTPRGAKSVWSKINRAKADELIAAGKMKTAGLQAIEKAKQDGRWEAAYDSQSKATVPDDFQVELDGNPKAKKFFATLNSVNRYAILFRIQTAKKAETRAKRIQLFIQMLEKGEKIHP